MLVANSVAMVSGGGSGLGAAVARMIIGAGGAVAILDLPSSPGARLADELGSKAVFISTDITNPTQVTAAVDQTGDRFGRIDVGVNCAGISPGQRVRARDGGMHPLDVFVRTVEVNLIGTFDVIRNVVRRMAEQQPGEDGERGLIVNTASIAGYEGQVGQAAYASSKGGVIALTLPLARELSVFGIRVMCIAPGIMDTPMLAGLNEERRARLIDISVFPKRLGRPEDFADLVLSFMVQPMLNGEVVRLDSATRLAPR
jgi:3-hydroxyacyl-CoA dehydrogenase/3-hydroxy-2-methylbutyryl-CoA dehydrogenase